MMKVSDPKIFGAVVLAYFKPLFAKHAALFDQLGVDITNGFDDVIQKAPVCYEIGLFTFSLHVPLIYRYKHCH
jgi:monomeric isocitrate dehydrogenase